MPKDAPSPPLLLGVDAGGTKSRALLATAGPKQLFCVHGVGVAGPGNPMSHGLAAAVEAILTAIRQAIAPLGDVPPLIECAVVAAAGAANEALRSGLEEQLTAAGVAHTCRVIPDYEPFFSLVDPPAVGVISGTGSVAFALESNGQLHRAGGWGYLIGDEGSGYAIGRHALRVALMELDAGDATSPLARAVMGSLRVAGRSDLLDAVYTADDQRSRIAQLARTVIELSQSDALAAGLLQQASHALASVVVRAARNAGFAENSYTLSLGGGILVASEVFRQTLLEQLAGEGFSPSRVLVVRDPAVGCLAAARRLSSAAQ